MAKRSCVGTEKWRRRAPTLTNRALLNLKLLNPRFRERNCQRLSFCVERVKNRSFFLRRDRYLRRHAREQRRKRV